MLILYSLSSVMDYRRRVWDLPVTPACLLWLGALLESIWPPPWRKWSTSGKLMVSIRCLMFQCKKQCLAGVRDWTVRSTQYEGVLRFSDAHYK